LGNIFTAIQIAKTQPESKVKIRYHLEEKGAKNPELEVDGIVGDRVAVKGLQSIKNIFHGTTSKYGRIGQLKDYDESFLALDFQDRTVDVEEIWFISRYIDGQMKAKSKNAFNYFLIEDKVIRVDKGMGAKKIDNLLKRQMAD